MALEYAAPDDMGEQVVDDEEEPSGGEPYGRGGMADAARVRGDVRGARQGLMAVHDQIEVLERRPDRIEARMVEREGRIEEREHDALEPGLLGPGDLFDRILGVGPVDDRHAREPLGGDSAEIGQPSVVGPFGGTGVSPVRGWVPLGRRQSGRVQLEGQAEVGKQDLGRDALAIELSEPGVRIGASLEPTVIDHVLLPRLDELGVQALRQGRGVEVSRTHALVLDDEGIELFTELGVEVLPVLLHVRRGMAVARDHHQVLHGFPSPATMRR